METGRLENSIALLICGLLLSFAGCNLGAQQNNVAGNQAFQTGNSYQAINRFQQAINQNPRNADAYYNLGATFYTLGRPKPGLNPAVQDPNAAQYVARAEQLYQQAISLNGQHPEAHRGLAALLIETNRESAAFDLVKGWKDNNPQSAEPVIELARLYQEYGDSRHATDLLADAIRLDPNNVRAFTALGTLRESQGENLLALDNYIRALQLDQNQAGLAQRVASLQQRVAAANGQQFNSTGGTPRYGASNPWERR